MSYTFVQLQDEVLAYGFDDTVYRTRIKTWLNEAQRRVARDLDLPGLEASYSVPVVANTATYTLPLTFQRVNYVSNDTSTIQERLNAINKWDYEERDPLVFGAPMEYAVDALSGTGFQISFWPTPDFAYTIKARIIQTPTAMSADGDPIGLSALTTIQFDYEDLLISYALFRAYGSEDDSQQASYHYGIYTQGIAVCKADMLLLVNDTPERIGGTWSSI